MAQACWFELRMFLGRHKAQVALSCIGGGVLIIHVGFLKLDWIGFALVVLAALPWLVPVVQAISLPGGIGITLKQVTDASNKVIENVPTSTTTSGVEKEYRFPISTDDPYLVLVAIRIEIEKRLRDLAEKGGVESRQPLMRLVRNLERTEVLPPDLAGGLTELIEVGNRAAHGVKIEGDVLNWASTYADHVLRALDSL